MSSSKDAPSFDDIIQAGRKKRKAQDLADSLLSSSKNARSSLPGVNRNTRGGSSLASRIGVVKRSASAGPKSSINGKWSHDLHHVNNPRTSNLSRTASSSRSDRTHKITVALQRESTNNEASRNFNVRNAAGAQMSIKGMAATGPFVVIASNFAPGTSAADIEAAILGVGGQPEDCYLVSETPTVMAEIIYNDKASAENVIATFNNQKADGRLLYVYLKQGGPSPRIKKFPNTAAPPTKPAAPEPPIRAPNHQDHDLMDVEDTRSPLRDTRFSTQQPLGDDRAYPKSAPFYQNEQRDFRGGHFEDRNGSNYHNTRDSRGSLYSDNLYRRGRPYR